MPVFFIALLVVSLARAVRMVKKIAEGTAAGITDFYSQISIADNYYVGVIIRDGMFYVTWLWHETATRDRQIAENVKDYVARQIPSLKSALVVKKASPVKDSARADMRIGSMRSTPGVDAQAHFMLITLSSILSAGKFLREALKRKPKWNEL
jgi:hypothetical protein